MTTKEYQTILAFAWDEELERIREFIWSVDNSVDCAEDKPWTTQLEQVPSKAEMETWDMDLEGVLISLNHPDQSVREECYLLLRDLW